MKNSGLLILIISTFSVTAFGQEYEKAAFSLEGNYLNYRILYPDNFNSSKSYPVLLFLHGSGERGDDNEAQLVHGSKLFLDPEFRKNYPVVVIFPQCPTDDYWANVDINRDQYPLKLKFEEGKPPTQALQMVMALMDSIQSLKYSNDQKFYVMGLSMGGEGIYELLERRPMMFAAAVPICGAGRPNNVAEYAKHTSIWAIHGAKDDVILPSYSTEMVIALMEAKADVKYTLFKDANHNSWDSAFSEPEMFPWMFSKSKRTDR